MALGRMNQRVQILEVRNVKNKNGFAEKEDVEIASVRAYVETINPSSRWERIIGSATFANVTAIFRVRMVSGLVIETSHFIVHREQRYNIISVEDVSGRGMYYEILAEKIEGVKT